jgi:hypothetical protein
LEGSRPKPGRMEQTPKGGRGPPWAVALLEREIVASGWLIYLNCMMMHGLTDLK